MLLKLYVLNIITMLIVLVQGYKYIGIHNSYKRLVKQIRTAASSIRAPIYTEWINQKLDHFNATETRTWKMRYLKRLDYWREDGPIYFILGGEDTAYPDFLKTGLIKEMARETNGAIFMTEHRYYGKSQPLKNRNLESLKFLTTQQALADIAKLIKTIKKQRQFKKSKIVIYGASYAGNLAAWMKVIYPELADATIASSAPVLAKRDFYEYLEVVEYVYKKYGTAGCLKYIQNIFKRYNSLFKTKKGIMQAKKEFNICEKVDLTKPENKGNYFTLILDYLIGDIQDSNINLIHSNCHQIMKSQFHGDKTCDEALFLKNESCCYHDFYKQVQLTSEDQTDHCWNYQVCTEYGYFVSSTSKKQHITKNIPVEWNDKFCTALFGPGFDKYRVIEGTRKINHLYGGRSLNVSKVVFVNGELDPWKSLSILKDISHEAPAVYIPKACHACELIIEKDDHLELKKARTHIKLLIKKWIGYMEPKTFKFNLTIRIL